MEWFLTYQLQQDPAGIKENFEEAIGK